MEITLVPSVMMMDKLVAAVEFSSTVLPAQSTYNFYRPDVFPQPCIIIAVSAKKKTINLT